MDKELRRVMRLSGSGAAVAAAYAIAAMILSMTLGMYLISFAIVIALLLVLELHIVLSRKSASKADVGRLGEICSLVQEGINSGFGIIPAMRTALAAFPKEGASYSSFFEALALSETGTAPDEAFAEVASRQKDRALAAALLSLAGTLSASGEKGFGIEGEAIASKSRDSIRRGESSFQRGSVFAVFSGSVLPTIAAFAFIGYSIVSSGGSTLLAMPLALDAALPVLYSVSLMLMNKFYTGA